MQRQVIPTRDRELRNSIEALRAHQERSEINPILGVPLTSANRQGHGGLEALLSEHLTEAQKMEAAGTIRTELTNLLRNESQNSILGNEIFESLIVLAKHFPVNNQNDDNHKFLCPIDFTDIDHVADRNLQANDDDGIPLESGHIVRKSNLAHYYGLPNGYGTNQGRNETYAKNPVTNERMSERQLQYLRDCGIRVNVPTPGVLATHEILQILGMDGGGFNGAPGTPGVANVLVAGGPTNFANNFFPDNGSARRFATMAGAVGGGVLGLGVGYIASWVLFITMLAAAPFTGPAIGVIFGAAALGGLYNKLRGSNFARSFLAISWGGMVSYAFASLVIPGGISLLASMGAFSAAAAMTATAITATLVLPYLAGGLFVIGMLSELFKRGALESAFRFLPRVANAIIGPICIYGGALAGALIGGVVGFGFSLFCLPDLGSAQEAAPAEAVMGGAQAAMLRGMATENGVSPSAMVTVEVEPSVQRPLRTTNFPAPVNSSTSVREDQEETFEPRALALR